MKFTAHSSACHTSMSKTIEDQLKANQAAVASKADQAVSQTEKMINKDFFKKMKTGAVFINTSRGKVVVEKDLLEACEAGKLMGAALDVFEEEPLGVSSPLILNDKVILTPHTAGQTKESIINVSIDSAQQIRDFFCTGALTNAVNAEP